VKGEIEWVLCIGGNILPAPSAVIDNSGPSNDCRWSWNGQIVSKAKYESNGCRWKGRVAGERAGEGLRHCGWAFNSGFWVAGTEWNGVGEVEWCMHCPFEEQRVNGL